MENKYDGKFAAVLTAGGIGKRMGTTIPKQLLELNGKPVFLYSLETFLSMKEIEQVVLVVPTQFQLFFETEIKKQKNRNVLEGDLNKLKIVEGGKERYLSVKNGILALNGTAEYVLVHDVARPFISKEIIQDVCKTLIEKGSCLVAKPVVDTIKIVKDHIIQNTIDRNLVWCAQTPQGAKISLLKNLYNKMEKESLEFIPTDEASILEHFGEKVYIVKGNSLNDKLTTPEDFKLFSKLCLF